MQKFLEMAAHRNFLVLDTETTGLHHGGICQIAIINARGEILLDSFVQTMESIPPDATAIHGITDDVVRGAPHWCDLWENVHSIIRDTDLVVYNATYDRKMFHQTGERNFMEKIEWKDVARWWCAMEAYAEFYGDWNSFRHNYKWQSLTNAARQCGIEVNGAHSALGDCQMTLQVINHMLRGQREDA